MKKFTRFRTLATLMAPLALVCACQGGSKEDEPEAPPQETEIALTQEMLNASSLVIASNVTGTQTFSGAGSHGGTHPSPDSTYRDIYSNRASGGATYGRLFTKRIYKRNADGSRGPLLRFYAMLHQPDGYFADGGDWQYIMMPNTPDTDLSVTPMGRLDKATINGRQATCAGCHRQAAGDYLFHE